MCRALEHGATKEELLEAIQAASVSGKSHGTEHSRHGKQRQGTVFGGEVVYCSANVIFADDSAFPTALWHNSVHIA